MSGEGSVHIKNLVKTYLDEHGNPSFTAVKNINLEIENGEFMVLVGPSGCGKSTTLRMLAGLEAITSGTIAIGERVVNNIHPKDRGIAMVFQNYALYPHMTIFDNIAFGLKLAKKPKDFIQKTVTKTAQSLGLEKMLDRKPGALSGGQRQRVALGRAIVRDPKVFLFDEPLSNLDAKMRVHMRSEISRLHTQMTTTMVYVTHDQVEAMTMGDRICVMRDGLIMQVADPLTLYRQPENIFVAGFIGSPPMNLLKGNVEKLDGGLAFVEEAKEHALTIPLRGPLETLAAKYVGKPIVFGIRPEHLSDQVSDPDHVPITATIEISEPMGSESIVYFKSATGSLIARVPGEHIYHPGEQLTVQLNMEKVHLFDSQTESIIKG
jgi:multiple sugar transport system ATP-binding protein